MMKLIKVEDVSPVAKKLTVEIDGTAVGQALDKAFGRLGREVRLKGFRPGKAPRHVLERYYGPQLGQEVAADLIEASLPEALEEGGFKPAVRPKLEPGVVKKGEPFQYQVTVEVKPEIQIDNYLGLALTRLEKVIPAETVTARLEDLRQAHAKLEAAPEGKAAEKGDVLTVDLAASRDGQPLAKGQLKDFDLLLGRGMMGQELEEGLAGLVKGESRELTAAFPKNFFHDALAGKRLTVKVTLKELRVPVKPELSDEFAKSVGPGFDSVAALTDMVRSQLEKSAGQEADRKVQDQLLDQLLALTSFDVPEGLVDLELSRMLVQVENSLVRQGLNFESAGLDEAKLMADLKPQALRRVQEDLILEAIALKEGWSIDDEKLEEGFHEMANQMGQNVEQVKRFHQEQNMTETFRAGLSRRETLKRLIDGATIKVERVAATDPTQESPSTEK